MTALEYADYGIVGEGEVTICELADAIEGKLDINDVNGLIIKQKNELYSLTKRREEIMELDTIPYPDYDGFEYNDLLDKTIGLDLYSGYSERLGYISLSRSCPFNCTFCFHPSGTKYRRRKFDNVFKEIDYLLEKFDIHNLMISDELFLGNMDDAVEFCREIKKRNIGFAVSLRVDMVNKDILELLKDSGCFQIGFGIESADNRILKSMNKHINISQIENALKICYDIGLNCQGNFIFGDQAETLETAQNTITWWQANPQYNISLHMIVCYPGSILYDVACAKGIIKDKVQFIKDGCPLINVSKLTDTEYKELALRISMLPKKSVHKLEEVKLKYIGRGKVDFNSKCPRCGTVNYWRGLDVFRNLALQVCFNCKKSLFINVYEYAEDIINDEFKKLKNKKIAFWPMASSAGAIIQAIPSILVDENVYLLDSSKYGIKYKNKEIYHPSIIKELNINTVFLTVTTPVSQEITNIIKNEYPSVKNILFAGDLLNSHKIDLLKDRE